MTHRFSVALVVLATTAACSGSSKKSTGTSDCFYGDCRKKATPAPAEPAAGPAPKVNGPVGEKAQALREAADLLEKAEAARASGNRNLADQLFSTAELITGPEALAAIAAPFREGAPPRITTPTQKVDPSAPRQPRVAGSSEAEDEADKVPPPPKAEVGSLTGTLKIDGKAAPGTYGLITLEPASGKWKPRTPKHVVIEQRNREFLPKLVAVSVGSTIAFPNFDPTFHNVFSTSPLAPFDLGLYKMGEQREYTFAKEGFVRLGCNLHANMQAFIAVVAAPAYVVTDDEGRFAFKRLAPGKYKLHAWSMRSTQPITQDITIRPGKNSLDVGVSGDAPAGPAPDKFGGKRG
jgi:plastocyanin